MATTNSNVLTVSAIPVSTPPPSSAAPSSFLPLTTAFPVPTSCFRELYTAIFTSLDITAFRDYSAVRSECYPESYGQFEYPTINAESSWYSPAVCPSGYPVASWEYDGEVSATRAWCCPGTESEWWVPTFPWGGYGGRRVCISTVTTSTSLVLPGQSTLLTDFFSAYDWPISVMWAQSDLTKFATTSMSSTVHRTSALATPPPSAPPSPPSLSTEAKAGIGAGVGIPLVALLAAGLIFYRRRKVRRAQRSADMVQVAPVVDTDPGKDIAYRPVISEMDPDNTWTPQHELDSRSLPAYRPYKPSQ